MATSSTRFANLNYWVDVKTGFDYLVQIQVPPDAMTKAGRRRDPAARVGQSAGQPDDPRRGHGHAERAARRARPRHVAALPDPDRQRRGRGHGPGLAARSPQAIDAAGEPPRGVRVEPMGQLPPMMAMFKALGIGLARRRVRDPRAADRLLPVAAAGPDLDRRRAGRARRHRHHPLLHAHLAEHRVVHGLDHVPGRVGVQLGHARDLHERPLEDGQVLDRRRPSSAPASVCGRS